MNWYLSRFFSAGVVFFILFLFWLLFFCALFVVFLFALVLGLFLFLFMFLCRHRDKTQDYISLLHQFTFEATTPQMVYVGNNSLINFNLQHRIERVERPGENHEGVGQRPQRTHDRRIQRG